MTNRYNYQDNLELIKISFGINLQTKPLPIQKWLKTTPKFGTQLTETVMSTSQAVLTNSIFKGYFYTLVFTKEYGFLYVHV